MKIFTNYQESLWGGGGGGGGVIYAVTIIDMDTPFIPFVVHNIKDLVDNVKKCLTPSLQVVCDTLT